MAAPQSYAAAAQLTQEVVQVQQTYNAILNACNSFVTAGTALQSDSSASILSSGFKTQALAILSQVQSFLGTAPATLPAP